MSVFQKVTSRLLLLAAVLFSGIFIGSGLNAQEPELRRAPLNPAYVEWEAKQKERAERQAQGLPVEPVDKRFGYIPPSFQLPEFKGTATQIEA
ncbi:MAG: hypothetical protein LBQ86_09180, partial [Holophagales bacterium]|nr:hypothetical protein [Holophagales bacterium]